jgi:hypothetical protein
MTNLPEDPLREPILPPSSESSGPSDSAQQQAAPSPYGENSRAFEPPAPSFSYPPPTSPEPPLFQSYAQPPVRRLQSRIPNFGHLLLSVAPYYCRLQHSDHRPGSGLTLSSLWLAAFAEICHRPRLQPLASEAILYLVTFGFSLFVFPMVWNESLFAGLQWRGTSGAFEIRVCSPQSALGCFGLAGLDQILLPGPANSPIEKMISSPGAAWLMFAFGVTMAPFFEEMFFRGFLLPALCTACDWIAEKMQPHASPSARRRTVIRSGRCPP